MQFALISKVLINILNVYKLVKAHNEICKYDKTLVSTIIIYQAKSMSQRDLAFELYPSHLY